MSGPIEPSETIIACSTGNESDTAISVIRISGLFDLKILDNVFSRPLSQSSSMQLSRSNLIFNDQVVDDVVYTLFKAPNSYTGENVVEISCHGNRLNIEKIINLFISSFEFIRMAKPGEFTLRALKNKKMTLSEVEGLDMLLNAQHSYAFSHGLSLLNGDLSKSYKNLLSNFLDLRVKVELLMDFSDDVGEEQGEKLFLDSFRKFSSFVNRLASRVSGNEDELLSPKVVLAGPVNSGKSTLFNEILHADRSIVSDEAGTTRDYVSERFSTGQLNCQLIDTAGIRSTDNKVEIEGIKRSIELFTNCFFKILVIDVNKYKSYFKEIKQALPDAIVLTHMDKLSGELGLELTKDTPYILSSYSTGQNSYVLVDTLIWQSSDRGGVGPIEPSNFQNSGPIEPKSSVVKNGPIGPILKIKNGPMGPELDIKNGPMGPEIKLDYLNKLYLNKALSLPKCLKLLVNNKYEDLYSNEPILLSRHKSLIIRVNECVKYLSEQMTLQGLDLGIITNELENIESSLEELIGIINRDEVLDSIFSNFCIGK